MNKQLRASLQTCLQSCQTMLNCVREGDWQTASDYQETCHNTLRTAFQSSVELEDVIHVQKMLNEIISIHRTIEALSCQEQTVLQGKLESIHNKQKLEQNYQN